MEISTTNPEKSCLLIGRYIESAVIGGNERGIVYSVEFDC